MREKVQRQIQVSSNCYESGYATPPPEDVFYLPSKPLDELETWMACMKHEAQIVELSIYRHLSQHTDVLVRFGYPDFRSNI